MRRQGRGVAVAAVVALTAAGCGGAGGNQGGTSQHPFTTADLVLAAKRTQSTSARMDGSFTLAGTVVHGSGFFDLRRKRGQMTMAVAGQTIREVFVFPRIYVELPPQASSHLPAGKRWVMVDLQKAKGGALGQLSQSSGDPTQGLQRLRAAGSVRRVGTATVRGAATTHYHATIDLRRAAAQEPRALRPFVRKQIAKVIAQTGSATMPVDVWIDTGHRVRREKMAFPSAAGSVTVDMTLYDFGARQRVTPPPPSQTVDMSKVAAKAIQSGGAGG